MNHKPRFDRSLFGGWSLDINVLEYMIEHVPIGSTMLVFGAGATTPELSKAWRLTTIEHDPQYAVQYGAIHAPLVAGWYDTEAVNRAIDGLNPDVVVIDGPPGDVSNRQLMAYFMDLDTLGQPSLWVIDDTHRQEERNLAVLIQEHAGRRSRDIQCGQGKRASVV